MGLEGCWNTREGDGMGLEEGCWGLLDDIGLENKFWEAGERDDVEHGNIDVK